MMRPEDNFNCSVKVYIPEFYELFRKTELLETLGEAIKGLAVSNYKLEDDRESDGAWLYLFSAKIFPFVAKGDETPDGTLWLSASEGWKVKWSKLIKSPILTVH